MTRRGPLHGARVLDLSTTFSGPYCTRQLADLGAAVLKVEAPGGDVTRNLGTIARPGMSSVYASANRDKATVLIDLKSAGGRQEMRRLLARADVLVHNMRPAAAERLGIGPDAALGINPRLVHVAITGYGSDGPDAGRPAYDDTIQAASGLSWLQSMHSEDPAYLATPLADKVAGMSAAQAVLAGLLHRERTGEGQAVEVPMFETLAGFALMEQWGGRAFSPSLGDTGYRRMRSPYRRPYRTRDGVVSVVVYHDGHWRRFFDLIGEPEVLEDERFATPAARNEHIDDLYALLERRMAERSTSEWLKALDDADIPAAAVRSLDDLFDDEHLTAVDFFQEVEDARGERYVATRAPWRFSRTPVADPRDRPGPMLPDEGRGAALEAWLEGSEER
ncbi:CoA transferase [Actinomadura sp. KC345]|uniref:CaiB/BaiF CoA transferase family protein n=1 Tax=Actinomadura sp. KC345 TaxID=2530371 RepID=UPI001404E122|nr:CoA transferase [Actinomadura sp. KC345]